MKLKLFEVERKRWVIPVEDAKAPPGARPVKGGEPVFFEHVDGMYSLCIDVNGNPVHLPAWQEVRYKDE